MQHIMQTILCLGDSNTYGYDPRSYLPGRYPEGIRWTSLIKSDNRKIINYGQNGLSVPRHPDLYVNTILRQAPDVLLVMLGTNDLLNGRSSDETAARMEHFISCLKLQASSQIILIAPPPLQPGTWVEKNDMIEQSIRLAGLYQELAKRNGIHFADAFAWNIELLFDGVHFSPAGHKAFANGILKDIPSAGGIR